MADTLVERVTGRPADTATPIAVNLVVSDDTLFGAGSEPARLAGYGPVPAAVARNLTRTAVYDRQSKATLRRLYKHPASGALVAMESRARRFPRGLATFIATRDDTCTTPYCDAPIRHIDHADPAARGGPTTTDNGRGTCAACNYAKEADGWRVTTVTHENGVHTTELTTPTDSRYRSTAPPLPGRITISEVELNIDGAIARHAA
jgi:hypothetical protein